jgi:hypothetical protein
MEHTKQELIKQLKEMHPELERHNVQLDAEFNQDKDAWVIKMEKADAKLHTYLDKKDADACLEGVQCVYFGVQVGQFMENLKLVGHI